MIEEEATGTLDFEALRHAIERRDPEALLRFYAQDAELRIVHAALPEDKAFELKGRAQIERYLKAICDQQVSCLVEDGIVPDAGSVEFRQECHYPSGSPISVRTTLEVAEGLIVRQTEVVERANGEDRGDERGEG